MESKKMLMMAIAAIASSVTGAVIVMYLSQHFGKLSSMGIGV